MSQIRDTRTARRPELKLVGRAPTSAPDRISGNIVHDERGNAIWTGEPATLEDAALTLAIDPSAARMIEGDPYNQSVRASRSKARSR
jgi:hypothetical protein